MTVAHLRHVVPAQEWVEWQVYYGRQMQRRELR